MAEHWSCWLSLGRAPEFNMAFDEIALHRASLTGAPLLRFYSWSAPAATFGYFQRYNQIAELTPLRPLLRRPTGGGLVPHLNDWTYSLAVPAGHPWYSLQAIESYQRFHSWIQTSLDRCGLSVELAGECNREQPGQCFVGSEPYDVLYLGRKIAGAAQRRTRDGLLIQGSLQPAFDKPTFEDWRDAMQQSAADLWSIEWQSFTFSEEWKAAVNTLAAEKYDPGSPYHRRR